jgi:hypothetical protein
LVFVWLNKLNEPKSITSKTDNFFVSIKYFVANLISITLLISTEWLRVSRRSGCWSLDSGYWILEAIIKKLPTFLVNEN